MVLAFGFAESVNRGDSDAVAAWLDGLERPEDIRRAERLLRRRRTRLPRS